MNRYVRVDRGSGSRAGQLLQHVDDPKRWQVRTFIGRDAKGKKQYRSEIVHGGKRDAERRLTDLLQSKNHGKLTPRTTATVADLAREWIAHKGRDVSARTLKGYEDTLTHYVLPTLGHKRLEEITLRQIDALYGAMQAGKMPPPETDADGKAVGWQGGALSARTVRLAHVALSQALSQAVKWGMISYNPALEATIPSGKSKVKRALSAVERARFLEASMDAFHQMLYRLLMDTGLRPGEACALTWADVDFPAERLTVARTVTRGSDGAAVSAPPKTHTSKRTLPLFGLRDELLAHKAWQVEHGLDGSGYVFTNQNGRPLTPWTFSRRELARTLKAAGIPSDFSLYGFRHTFATLHLSSGTPLKVVSDWLGHSTIQQTANTYQHLSVDVSDDWAQRHVAFLAATVQAESARVAN